MEFLIPTRTARPADDPIFALNAEANARKAKGESVINATVGALLDDDGKLAVLPSVIEALREVPPVQAAGYAPLAGPQAFLQAVIGDLLGGSPLAEHAIAVATPGGTGALRHAVANFLEPGQALLTSSFYWGPYKTIADENDRKVATFPMFQWNGDEGELDLEAFDRSLNEVAQKQGRALVFLNDPCQNPTGYSMRPAQWRAVRESVEAVAAKVPTTLLVDAAYFLYGAGDPRAFLQHLQPLMGKAALAFAWSASKSFTQYGARVGALLVVDPEVTRRKRTLDALAYSCRGTWSNCNHLGMLAITKMLSDASLRAKVDSERAGLTALLGGRVKAFNAAAKGQGLRYPRYDGGFFTTVVAPSGVDVASAAAKLRERGVFVVPQGDGLRIALCSVAERDVPRLVEEVVAALR
ncbi:MAG: aminotransferase class I/II-fold pyridoxal phosphate-dependent enzyme [Deltaproteobacteria bacterium]|nr:aminotransferase class I/II-fold pyridoxal phosphate-dependent enzyme [Deltaproteobacteria bacterium]